MLKNKFARRLTYVGVGAFTFVGSAISTLALIPSETINSDFPSKPSTSTSKTSTYEEPPIIDNEMTLTDKFILKMQNDITTGLTASFNDADFKIHSKNNEDALNIISLDGGSLNLIVNSLDDISIGLNLPLNYNGKEKELNLSWVDNMIYFDVNDSTSAWDLKYKIDLSPYDVTDEDGEILGRAEQGDLDFIYEDIVQAIGHDINIDFGGIAGGDTLDKMQEALGNMVSKEKENGYDFFLELPIKDVVLPICLSSDKDFTLNNVRFPAWQDGKDTPFVLNDMIEISLDVSIDIGPVNIVKPANEEAYSPLVNSLGIFNNIYPYVDSPKFGFEMDASLTHDEEARINSDGTISKEAVHETALIDLRADLDVSNMQEIIASMELGVSAYDDNETLFRQKLGLSYFGENNEETTDGKAFINISDIAKMRTSKLTMDSLIGKLKANLESDKDDASTIDQITNILAFLKDSTLLNAIKRGTYEPVVDMIAYLKNSDNKLIVGVSLAPLNIEGTIEIVIDGADNHSSGSLLTIDFQEIKLSSFTFDGTLKLASYIEPAYPDLEEYAEMSHLPGVFDQVSEIVASKQAAMSINGSIMSVGEMNANKTHQIGFEFAGNLAFDLTKKGGTGHISFVDYKEDYTQEHSVTIDIQGPENEVEDESNANSMLFTYESGSSSGKKLKGRASISALNDIIDLVKGLIGSNDKRFARYREQINSMAAGALLKSLTSGKYTSLIASSLLDSVTINENKNTFVISKDALGTSEPVVIDINFANGRLSTIDLALTMDGLFSKDGPAKEIRLSIGLNKTSLNDDELLSLSDQNLNSYTDFTSIGKLLDMVVGSALLGSSETNSLSTYHLTGSISISTNLLLKLDDTIKFDFYVAVDGRSVDLYGVITMPVIVGLNGSYATLLSSKRTTTLYYQTSNDNLDGTVWITRDADYLGWSHDNTEKNAPKKVRGSDFRNNLLSWVGGYMMGFNNNSSIKELLEGTAKKDEAAQPIHFEDCLNTFSFDPSTYVWTIGLNVGELAHNDTLKDANVTLKANKDMRTLSELSATLNLELINVIKLEAAIDATLDNIKNNVYTDCWTNSSAKTAYTNYITSHANDEWSPASAAFDK